MTEELPLPTRTRVAIGVVIALQTVAAATAVLVGSDRDAPDWSIWVQGIAGIAVWVAPFMLKELIAHPRKARALGRRPSRPAWVALVLFGIETVGILLVVVMSIRSSFLAIRAVR